jgi:ABC-type multidrug transport system fused ATPase/permease subunit
MVYKPGLPHALRDLTFTLKPGQRIAVVGRTGAGKSSLFQILAGFRRPTEGKLKINGKDVREYPLKELRQRLNVVFQNPFIIESDSIRDNLDPLNLYSE